MFGPNVKLCKGTRSKGGRCRGLANLSGYCPVHSGRLGRSEGRWTPVSVMVQDEAPKPVRRVGV